MYAGVSDTLRPDQSEVRSCRRDKGFRIRSEEGGTAATPQQTGVERNGGLPSWMWRPSKAARSGMNISARPEGAFFFCRRTASRIVTLTPCEASALDLPNASEAPYAPPRSMAGRACTP